MAHSENNNLSSAFKTERETLTGPNFNEWYRSLRIVLRVADTFDYLYKPCPDQPDDTATEVEKAALRAEYKKHSDVACIMLGKMSPALQRQFENYPPQNMLAELRKMFEKPPAVEIYDLVDALHSCRQALVNPTHGPSCFGGNPMVAGNPMAGGNLMGRNPMVGGNPTIHNKVNRATPPFLDHRRIEQKEKIQETENDDKRGDKRKHKDRDKQRKGKDKKDKKMERRRNRRKKASRRKPRGTRTNASRRVIPLPFLIVCLHNLWKLVFKALVQKESIRRGKIWSLMVFFM
nr:hypothetical protein [Tanacetum cinerariifolium]